MESKARLEYAGLGMTLGTIKSHEYMDGMGDWYRIEVYRTKSGIMEAMAYKRCGAYWKPFWSQRTAMEKRVLLEKAEQEREMA